MMSLVVSRSLDCLATEDSMCFGFGETVPPSSCSWRIFGRLLRRSAGAAIWYMVETGTTSWPAVADLTCLTRRAPDVHSLNAITKVYSYNSITSSKHGFQTASYFQGRTVYHRGALFIAVQSETYAHTPSGQESQTG